MDEDGFYFGEHLDGRKGLIPYNFIEKLTGEDLFEFQANILYGHKPESLLDDNGSCQLGLFSNSNEVPNSALGSSAGIFPPEFYDALLTDAMQHTNFQHLLAPGKCGSLSHQILLVPLGSFLDASESCDLVSVVLF